MKRTVAGMMMAVFLLAGTASLMHLTEITLNAAEQEMPMPTAGERQTLQTLHSQLAEFKSELAEAGKYSCCLTEGCDFCALAGAMCPCGMKLSAGEAVCGECKMGWQAGQGALRGVNPDDVESLPDPMAKMMMEMRNMQKGGMQ